jgi:hypothetical protein
MQGSFRSAPGFFAALGGALAGFIAGGVLAVLFLLPFALASSTAFAVGTADGYRGLERFILATFILALVQLFVTAWVTQHAASLLGDAPVRFRRALAGVFLGYLTNLLLGSAVAGVASLPIVGGAWIGLVAVALVISSARSAPMVSAT